MPHLSSSVPAENAVVATAPTVLQLNFSEAVNLKFSGVTLLGPVRISSFDISAITFAVQSWPDRVRSFTLPSLMRAAVGIHLDGV